MRFLDLVRVIDRGEIGVKIFLKLHSMTSPLLAIRQRREHPVPSHPEIRSKQVPLQKKKRTTHSSLAIVRRGRDEYILLR